MNIPSYERNKEIVYKCKLVIPAFSAHLWFSHLYVGRMEELDKYI